MATLSQVLTLPLMKVCNLFFYQGKYIVWDQSLVKSDSSAKVKLNVFCQVKFQFLNQIYFFEFQICSNLNERSRFILFFQLNFAGEFFRQGTERLLSEDLPVKTMRHSLYSVSSN